MNNKGFLLIDSLVTIVIVLSLCSLCFGVYQLVSNNQRIYEEYLKQENEKYDYLYSYLGSCEKCEIQEDLHSPEP